MQGLAEFFEEGGLFMYINLVTSAIVVGTVLERVVFIFTKYRVNAREFLNQIKKLVQAGNIDRAIKLCEAAPLPLLRRGLCALSPGLCSLPCRRRASVPRRASSLALRR